MSIKDKVAIITGASRGIGHEIALKLADEKVKLFLTSRKIENLRKIEEQLKKREVEYCIYPADLEKEESANIIIDEAIKFFGGIDFLINNAGIAIPGDVETLDVKTFDKHMKINARAPFLLSKEALKYLKKSQAPIIINMASVVGRKGYENQGAYSASKHALMGITKVMAREFQKYGIRVCAVSPGGVLTEMVTDTRPDLDESVLIKPQEIADAVLFLLKYRGRGVIDEIRIRREKSTPFA